MYADYSPGPGKIALLVRQSFGVEGGLAVVPGDRIHVSRPEAEKMVKDEWAEYTGLDAAARAFKAAGAKRVVGKLTPEAREAARAAGLGISGPTTENTGP